MDDLFRLLVVRAPDATVQSVTVKLPIGNPPAPRPPVQPMATGLPTDFQRALTDARSAQAHPQQQMWTLAQQFVASSSFIANVDTLSLAKALREFNGRLVRLPDPTSLRALHGVVTGAFGRDASQLASASDFNSEASGLGDALIAANLTVQTQVRSLEDHALFLRLMSLVSRIAADDPALSNPGAVRAAHAASLILPDSIFPVDPAMIQPMAVGDDWVVRQHIARYELGEIASIENVLKGESRKHSTKHSLSTEQTLVIETEKTTETLKELQTTDRFDLKSEVEQTLKQDLNIKAGVSVKYESSPWTVTANGDISSAVSRSDSSKLATEHSKDVVQRASTKVTERVRQQQTTKITESFEQDDEHGFDNSAGTQHVTGIYQWINKIHRVQTFDLGPRILYDLMVPEPAALLWDLKVQPGSVPKAVKPVPFTAHPGNLDIDSIGQYLAMYGVTGVPAPPEAEVTVALSAAGVKDEEKFKTDLLKIPDGYEAKTGYALTSPTFKSDKWLVRVVLGRKEFFFDKNSKVLGFEVQLDGEQGELPVAIDALDDVIDYNLTVDVRCELTAAAKAKWQLAAHDAIMQTYLQRLKEYEDAVAAQAFQAAATTGVTGTNPEANRQVERVELKRQAIALLAGPTIDLLGFNAVDEDAKPPLYPRPNADRAEHDGRIARFFEQALEWENMNYFFYPYYWGRKNTWYDRVEADDADPLFAEFLRAGQARVVVPVRKGFEDDIEYFVRSGGQLWRGAPLPDVHRSDYLPIAQEIRDAQTTDVGTPGDSWEVNLPTNQMYLRADRVLPSWTVDDNWKWTPTPDPGQ